MSKYINQSLIHILLFAILLANQFPKFSNSYPYQFWGAILIIILFINFNYLVPKCSGNSRRKSISIYLYLLPLIFFILYIPFVSQYSISSIKASFKFIVIALFIYTIIKINVKIKSLETMLIALLIFNAIILFFAFTGLMPKLFEGNARCGITWSPHGYLWGLSGMIFPFLLYNSLVQQNSIRFLTYFLLTVFAFAIILIDGSRTGLLIILIGGLFAIFLAYSHATNKIKFMLLLVTSLLLMTSFVLYLFYFSSKIFSPHSCDRGINNLFNILFPFLVTSRDVIPLHSVFVDNERFLHLEIAHSVILNPSLFGSGWLSTLSANNFVLHNTYMQIFSDLGIIGLFIYFSIFFPLILFAIRWFFDSHREGGCFLLVSIFFGHAISSFFHPVSTEFNNWYLIGFSLGFAIKLLTSRRS